MTASVVFPLLPTRAQAALKYRALLVHERWMPSAIRDRYGGELAIVSSGPASWWRVRRRFVAHSGGAPYSYFSRLASLYGMEVSYPFLDVRIVDFLLRTPPDALYTNGRPKALVREALSDILPPAIRDRTDNPAPAALVDSSLREHGAAFLRALLVDSELERRGYVVPGPWKHSVERYLRGEDDLRGVCWNSLTVEMWLRAQEDRLPPQPQKPEVTAVAG